MAAPQAAAKGLAFTVRAPDDDAVVVTDPDKLRQILLNLLSNAIKFTEQGEVALAADVVGETVRFTVRDTGVGIAPRTSSACSRTSGRWSEPKPARRVTGTGLGGRYAPGPPARRRRDRRQRRRRGQHLHARAPRRRARRARRARRRRRQRARRGARVGASRIGLTGATRGRGTIGTCSARARVVRPTERGRQPRRRCTPAADRFTNPRAVPPRPRAAAFDTRELPASTPSSMRPPDLTVPGRFFFARAEERSMTTPLSPSRTAARRRRTARRRSSARPRVARQDRADPRAD